MSRHTRVPWIRVAATWPKSLKMGMRLQLRVSLPPEVSGAPACPVPLTLRPRRELDLAVQQSLARDAELDAANPQMVSEADAPGEENVSCRGGWLRAGCLAIMPQASWKQAPIGPASPLLAAGDDSGRV